MISATTRTKRRFCQIWGTLPTRRRPKRAHQFKRNQDGLRTGTKNNSALDNSGLTSLPRVAAKIICEFRANATLGKFKAFLFLVLKILKVLCYAVIEVPSLMLSLDGTMEFCSVSQETKPSVCGKLTRTLVLAFTGNFFLHFKRKYFLDSRIARL